MSRVLITGGAGAIGGAVARRLLADPQYDVRIADGRVAPLWMREGCEIRNGDLRAPAQALAATKGCMLVVHLASYAPEEATAQLASDRPCAALAAPHTLLEHENAIHAAVVRAAIERDVERLVYVSSADVLARAEQLPTTEADLRECPAPDSTRAFARLSGERYCRAAHEQHGLPYAICRPSAVYGAAPAAYAGEPGVEPLIGELLAAALRGERSIVVGRPAEATCTPTHVDDVAAGIVLALDSPAALNEDFNLAGARELTLAELTQIVSEAATGDPDALALKSAEGVRGQPERRWPSAQKARKLLGWRARIGLEDGIAATVRALRAESSPAAAAAPARR